MKACKFVLGILLVSGAVLSAQETTPKYEVGVNYSWLHVNSANFDYQRTGNGGSGYFEYNLDKIVQNISFSQEDKQVGGTPMACTRRSQ